VIGLLSHGLLEPSTPPLKSKSGNLNGVQQVSGLLVVQHGNLRDNAIDSIGF
jgi:hypothetical protein